MAKKRGFSLAALFGDNDAKQDHEQSVEEIELAAIRPNPYQPRRTFDEAALQELAASIKESGVFQPIILRQPNPELNRYEIIAGERRFRASKLAGKTTIPAIVRTMSDSQMMEVAVLENLQREDLTPLEEAQAYQSLMDRLQLTQAQVAERLGKSRPYIANYLRLLGLPQPVKDMLENHRLSMGQARTLLGLKDERALVKLAQRAVKENLTVRQLEQLVAEQNQTVKPAKPAKKKVAAKKPAYVREAEEQLQSRFGTKVVMTAGKRGGKVEIPYTSDDDLTRILDLLGVKFD